MLSLAYAVICIVMAWINAYYIKKGRRIYHGVNGAVHLVLWIAVAAIAGWRVLVMPFIGRLVFDTSLNLFRGLKINYVSANPLSIVDRLEKAVFGLNGYAPKIIYIIIIIIAYVVQG